MGIRCFIAIDLPDEIKAALDTIAGTLKKPGGAIRWVRPENIHITLRFLGDTPEDKVEAIKEALARRASGYAPIEIRVKGAGAFPGLKSPSVLWAGLEFPQQLVELQKTIDSDMAALGFAPEGRPFKPHLTLARIKRGGRTPKVLMDKFAELGEIETGSFVATEVCLIQSRLRSTGPVYTPIARAPLSGK